MPKTIDNNELLNLSASDFYALLRPKECDLRIYLDTKKEKKSEPSPYEEVIRRLGKRHEKNHFEGFKKITDLSEGELEKRIEETKKAVKQGVSAIYQGAMQLETEIEGIPCLLTGIPDFLIKKGETYVIRDSKIARRINKQDHPEILRSVELYGYIFEQIFGKVPAGLEVHSGTNEIIPLEIDSNYSVLKELIVKVLKIKMASCEPYCPVGWTKCLGCGFHDRCWPKAEERKDPALVMGVDKGLAHALHEKGIHSIEQFLKDFDSKSLSAFERPYGKGLRKVGKAANSIILNAEAINSGCESIICKLEIPQHENYVMFDLEGIPPQFDEVGKIYLWGTQVFGQDPSPFHGALAGMGADGDKNGWEEFLNHSNSIFSKYGDIPFVHWHHYEKDFVKKYIEKYGDSEGVAERVLKNLLDLLPITQKSIVLPLSSYSLKAVEKYVGFERTQDEYGGDWAIAKYIEATEMKDEKKKQEILDDILLYNKEDLAATWAVFQWLINKIV